MIDASHQMTLLLDSKRSWKKDKLSVLKPGKNEEAEEMGGVKKV